MSGSSRFLSFLCLLLSSSLSSLGAQNPVYKSNTLIGWAASGTSTTPGSIDVQKVFPTCIPSTVRCTSVHLNSPVSYAGGTAYQPELQMVWTSDGLTIQGRYLSSCKAFCSFPATRALGTAGSRVSGLAYRRTVVGLAKWKKALFQLETVPGRAAIVTYIPVASPKACWTPVSKCSIPLPAGWIAAGLAYDQIHDVLFFSASGKNALGAWQNIIYAARAGSPCKLICKSPLVPNCQNGFIAGLAYDNRRGILYMTYGAMTKRVFVDLKTCFFKFDTACCRKGNRPWRGLALIPGWIKIPVGKPCAGKGCRLCLNMSPVTAGGDPALGNTGFRVHLANGPAGRWGFLVLGAGNCTKGISIPGLCGPLYPSFWIPPLVLGPHMILGRLCSGTTGQPLPIPVDARLAGQALCAQWLVLCRAGTGLGISMSNAITFTIADS